MIIILAEMIVKQFIFEALNMPLLSTMEIQETLGYHLEQSDIALRFSNIL